jgi:hypothetical protein
MAPILRQLLLHLLAATSVPLAVAVALALVAALPVWLSLPTFARGLIEAAVPVLAGVTLALYVWHFIATVRTYLRGRAPSSFVLPDPPPGLGVVARDLWAGVGSAFGFFLLLIGASLLVGFPARIFRPNQLTHDVFLWLERGALLVSVALLVFGLLLMTTWALRGILGSFHYEMNGARRPVRRRNLPFEVALAALPVFGLLLVAQLR